VILRTPRIGVEPEVMIEFQRYLADLARRYPDQKQRKMSPS
jgi:hypothetical protein